MAHKGLPRPRPLMLDKATILRGLVGLDRDQEASNRALAMETDFRTRIKSHVASLPHHGAKFSRFNTNPFVVMFYALQNEFERIGEIERAIIPTKVFSSMETSAGRMVEAIVLPQYGWKVVSSEMHSSDSVIDGRKIAGDTLCLTTLKSGPRCLNDAMSENFADAILANTSAWAKEAGIRKIEFTYGVLYGTKKQSNKKDWHILRNIAQKLASGVKESPEHQWHCRFKKGGVDVTVTIRIGIELWNYIAGHDLAFYEICTALLRSCIRPTDAEVPAHKYSIMDLEDIISIAEIPSTFNIKILQRSQLEWLFFFVRHFCDEMKSGDLASVPELL